MFDQFKLKKDNFIENIREGDKKARHWLIIFCGVLLFVIIGIWGLVHTFMGYRSFKVLAITEKTDDVSVNYQVMGDGLIRYSKDGASYLDQNGNVVWNQSFDMNNARVETCGNYMAIADIGSNQIRLFNANGQVGSVDALYPISTVKVSQQGVVAAILSDSSQQYITLYDSNGSDLVKIKATISKTGYPVDLALSKDGTKLAVSYLKVSGGSMSTQIIFYRFGKTDESINCVQGSYQYDSIFPKVEFINNTTMVAFGETGFEIYAMRDEGPEVVLEKTFDDDIKSIFYNEQYIGFVFRNQNSDADEESETAFELPADTEGPETVETRETVPFDDGFKDKETKETLEDSLGSEPRPFIFLTEPIYDSEGNYIGELDDAAWEPETVETESETETETLFESESVEMTPDGAISDETYDYTEGEIPEGAPLETETEMETNSGVYPSLNDQTAGQAAGSSSSRNGKYRYKMLVYTNAGKLYLDKSFNFDYHYIGCNNEEIIMYNENQCVMYTYKGAEKFSYTFENNINSLLPKQAKDEYILIDDNTIQEIKLR